MELAFAVILLSVFAVAFSENKITLHLKSALAVEGSTVTFTCEATGEIDEASVVLKAPGNTHKEALSQHLPKNIPEYNASIYGGDKVNIGDGKYNMSISINITAAIATNNATEIKCAFLFYSFDSDKTSAFMYIPTEILGSNEGFKTPQVFSPDPSTMILQWSPPWSHLVNHYIVTMVDRTNSEWHEYIVNSEDRALTITRNQSAEHDCHTHSMYVTAYTDVGNVKSDIVQGGFVFENYHGISESDVLVDVLMKEMDELKIEVQIVNVPRECTLVQSILYNFTMKTNNSHTETHGPLSVAETDFEIANLNKNNNYTLIVTYWDEQNTVNGTIHVHFSTNFSSTKCEPVYEVPTVNQLSASQCNCTTIAHSAAVIVPVAVFGTLMTVLLIAVFIIVTIFCLKYKRYAKRKEPVVINGVFPAPAPPPVPFRNRSTTLLSKPHTIKPLKKERRPSLPQVMATNPLYDKSSAIYTYIDASELHSANNHPQNEIPRQVQPPTKQNMDSPGVKMGAVLSLDKEFVRPAVDNPDCNEQYVMMQSNTTEQRYVKSPMMKIKSANGNSSGGNKELLVIEMHQNTCCLDDSLNESEKE